jgi:hypothetical protein
MNMEQIITLKVDLEYPEEAHHAIDEAVEIYEADKLKWTAAELAEAKRLAMQIMEQLCLDGHSISWYKVESYDLYSISVWLESEERKITNRTCSIDSSNWDVWIAKCVCLCRATGRNVPAFIIKKAGECW